MVNFIVGLEEKVSEETGTEISLADEIMALDEDSPLKTVAGLVQYVNSIVEEQ